MGFLDRQKAMRLRQFGVSRYHCNLEASRSFFPEVCTSHTWQEKVETLEIARDAGLDLCSGGIIGMGESLEQRLQLAFELRELGVLSIPINILTPIANTPLCRPDPAQPPGDPDHDRDVPPDQPRGRHPHGRRPHPDGG